MKIFEGTKIPVLAKALDAYSLRHKVISSNLANITTEGYHAQSVSFEVQLSGAMGGPQMEASTTNPSHLQSGPSNVGQASPAIVESGESIGATTDPQASGINDVDIDQEMTELAKNQLRFKFASKLLGESFRSLQKSIRGQL